MMRATLAALLVMCMAVEASASLGDLCPKGDEDCGENQVCDLNMAYGSNGIQIGARCVCKDKYEDNGQGSCTLIPGFCDFDVCNDYKDCEDCEAPLICAPTGVCAYPPAEYAGGAAGLASPSSPEDPEPNGGSGKQLGDLCPKGDQDCGENQVCDLNMAYGSNGIQIGARCVCKDKYEDNGQGSCTLIPGFCDFDVCNDYKDCEDCEAPLICAPTGVCAYPPAEYAGGAAGLASPSSPEDPEPNGGSGKQLGDLCPKGDQDCGENQVCDLNMAYGSNGIQIGARCKCQDGYEDDGEGVCRRIPHPFCLNDAWCGTVFANQICVLASNTCICKPGYETVPSPDGWVPSFTCQLAPGSCWNDADCPEGNVCDVESNACVAPPIGVAPASTVGIVFPSLPGGRADPLPRPGRGRDDDDDDDDAAAAVVRPSSPRDDTTTPPSRPPPREEEEEEEEEPGRPGRSFSVSTVLSSGN